MTKIKILHIGKYYPPFMGGIENFMRELLQQLGKTCQVQALVHHHQPFQRFHSEKDGAIWVHRVPSWGRLLFAPISPLFYFYCRRVLKQMQPDIIHIHMPNTSAFWLLLSARARKIPWVIHWHADVLCGQYRRLALAYPLYRPFETALLRRAKKIIATSNDYAQSSMPLAPFRDKTKIIPLGLVIQPEHNRNTTDTTETTTKPPCPSDIGWAENRYRLLAIGRLTYYKGFHLLIEAMRHLDTRFHLIIVGKGEQYTALQRQIQKCELQDRVQLAGWQSDPCVQRLLARCDLFVLSSIERTEAFGMVLLEAMQHKKPLLVTRVPGSGMNWVCQDQNNGLICKVTPKALAQAIQTLSKNPQLARQYGENGYQRLRQTFAIERIAEQVYALYQHILS